jgi:hypothetical protein
MKDLIADTIGKIKKQHISPEAKWKYLLKKYSIWALLGALIVFGGAAFSATYETLSSLDWDLYQFMHQSRIGYGLSIFPYFWSILFFLFAAFAFFDVRKTETGYRFSLLKISIITLGGIFVLGLLMSYFNLGRGFNGVMSNKLPYGKSMMVTKESQWNNPINGFLAGTILSNSASILSIDDLNGEKWNVQLNEKTLIRPRANVESGQMIKIIGTKLDGNNFQAIEIRPWIGMGMGGGEKSCGQVTSGCPMMRN